MRHIMPLLGVLVIAGQPGRIAAQSAEESIRAAVEAQVARDPEAALHHLERALAVDSNSYEANWRTAEILLDIGKQTPDSVKSPERDSTYARAERFGRRAVTLDSSGADGHYVLAAAIGRASLTKSKKERVQRAAEIRSEALRAIEIDPAHHKAYHVLGRWNAEIMRLSGLQRFFAKNFLGGKIFKAAAWDSAVVYMDKAIAIEPANIYHHLVLAEILIDRERYSEARIHLRQAETLPLYDVMDWAYQERAASLLQQIDGKKDKNG